MLMELATNNCSENSSLQSFVLHGQCFDNFLRFALTRRRFAAEAADVSAEAVSNAVHILPSQAVRVQVRIHFPDVAAGGFCVCFGHVVQRAGPWPRPVHQDHVAVFLVQEIY
jgi:hypothetical protein